RGRDGVLERPDGRVRARAVRGRHAPGSGGHGRMRGDDGGGRRRLRRGARRPRGPPLHRRRRVARADRGQGAPGRGGPVMSRTPFIAGNWKMYKSIAEAEEFIQALLPKVSTADGVDIAICAPFLALQALVDSARGSRVGIYAQTMHEADEGAFTGEVSPAMLAEIDVQGVVLGHSERRELFGETDRSLALKVPA